MSKGGVYMTKTQVQTAKFVMQAQDIDINALRLACANKDAVAGFGDDLWWMPEPSITRAWFKAVGLHSFPTINANGDAITLATLMSSQYSATGQQINIEHGLKPGSINPNGSPIAIGSIRELWVPWPEEGEDKVFPSAPVPVYFLACLWRKQAREIIADLKQPDLSGWSVSMEVRFTETEFWWKDQFWNPEDKPELYDYVNQEYDGSRVVRIIGGRDGIVEFQGFGMVKNPAFESAKILQAVATNNGQAVFNGGLVLLDYQDSISSNVVKPKKSGGSNNIMDKETLKFIEDAKTEAVAAAKVTWGTEKKAEIDQAVAAAIAEKDSLIASLEKQVADLTTAKDALQVEVDNFKLVQKGIERTQALAAEKITIPEKLQTAVQDKAKKMDDTEWASYVEELKTWSALAATHIDKNDKQVLVPIVPVVNTEQQESNQAVAGSNGFKDESGNVYTYEDLFAQAAQE